MTDIKDAQTLGSAMVELTDGERIILAILVEPIIPNAIGGGVAPIAAKRVAAIWNAAVVPIQQSADTDQWRERV